MLKGFVVLFFTSLVGLGAHAKEILLATYYNHLPWSSEKNLTQGLNVKLAQKLNRMSTGRFHFKAVYLPRKRLDKMLQEETAVAVPWVNPKFFDDEQKTKYLYTSKLAEDESYIVSSIDKPVEFTGLSSLKGKNFSASLGHNYLDIDPLVEKEQVRREDAPSFKEAILKLTIPNRNMDFGVIERSALVSFRQEFPGAAQRLYIARKPRTERYSRSILVPKKEKALHLFLEEAVRKLSQDSQWQSELQSLQLTSKR